MQLRALACAHHPGCWGRTAGQGLDRPPQDTVADPQRKAGNFRVGAGEQGHPRGQRPLPSSVLAVAGSQHPRPNPLSTHRESRPHARSEKSGERPQGFIPWWTASTKASRARLGSGGPFSREPNVLSSETSLPGPQGVARTAAPSGGASRQDPLRRSQQRAVCQRDLGPPQQAGEPHRAMGPAVPTHRESH